MKKSCTYAYNIFYDGWVELEREISFLIISHSLTIVLVVKYLKYLYQEFIFISSPKRKKSKPPGCVCDDFADGEYVKGK